MKFDLHSHTVYSSESKWPFESIIKPLQMIKTAIKVGLDGIAVTDHDTLKGAIECMKIVRRRKLSLKIILGVEITSEIGHILGLNIEDWDVRRGMGIEETIDVVKERGGIVVPAHPFASNPFRKGVREYIGKFDFDGVEVLNYHTSREDNEKALRAARKIGLGITAGSDSHIISDIGNVWVFSDDDDIINSILKGRTKVVGNEMSNLGRYTYQLNKILQLSRIFSA